jgi:hypothetical protein
MVRGARKDERMAHLWVEGRSVDGIAASWSLASLDGVSAAPLFADDGEALLLCSRAGEVESWLLMSIGRGRVSLNGETVHRIRVLSDRDEIRVAGRGRAFFSAERLARIEPFPGADKRVDCPRCKQPIAAGSAAVRCPNQSCGRWFHMDDEFPCWTYEGAPCICSQPTALDGGYRWSPEGI